MQGVQGHRDLRRIEAGTRLGKLPIKDHFINNSFVHTYIQVIESPVLLQPEEELSPGHEVQDHVELVDGLEGIYKMYQKRAVDVLQDGALRGGMGKLVSLHQGSLAQGLHRVEGACLVVFLLYQHYLAKTSFTQYLNIFGKMIFLNVQTVNIKKYIPVLCDLE